jgi:prolyl-tRNA synthetase
MRTRIFLRTTEFLWQEGHTAHETKEEAIEEAETMLDIYANFAKKYMAMPVIKGVKTANERFAGAVETYCIEALMQDGKALQAGTSHFLGQNFAKAFDVQFTTKEGKRSHVWATSWGVTTRLMGALIMTHSDDHGLVLPPNLAPIQVVVIPIHKTAEQLTQISLKVQQLIEALKNLGISIKYDDRTTYKPGWKFAEYELKGVPLRVSLGPRDLENGTFEIARRDTFEKKNIAQEGAAAYIEETLKEIQENLLQKATTSRDAHITKANSFEEFKELLETKGGFISAHWDGTEETADKIKQITKATIRCIPLNNPKEDGFCIFSGKESTQRVLFAKSY